MTEENNKLLNAALKYLDNGFSIVPVIGKRPCLEEWKIYQTQKPTKEEVENWFSQREVTGIGIITGSTSGIMVLDTEAGADLSEVIIPKTPNAKSGGGGIHFYFKYPEKGMKNYTRFRDLMDIKGEGGCVIAPPSLHSSGNFYEWITNLNEVPLADVPDWLEKDLEKNVISGSDKNWLEKLQGVSEGARNTSAVSVIGKFLKHFPISEWESIAWPALIGWNSQNSPPLSQEELRSAFNSISEKESDKRNPPELTGFWNPLTLKDVLKMKFPKNSFIVESLIPRKGITMISGQPGSGKSWIVLYIIKCIASNKKVFGKFKTKKGAILVIDGETDFEELKRRMELLQIRSNKRIHISSEYDMKIDKWEGLKNIIDFVKKEYISLVVLDPLIALHGSDENTATEMQKVMNAIKKITYAGAAVLIVHHQRKNGNDLNPNQSIRGSSAIHGAIDSHIEIKSENDDFEIMKISQPKARRGKAIQPFIIKMTENNGIKFEFLNQIEKKLTKEGVVKDVILSTLIADVGTDVESLLMQVNKRIDIGEGSLRVILKELEVFKKIKVEKHLGHNKSVYFKV